MKTSAHRIESSRIQIIFSLSFLLLFMPWSSKAEVAIDGSLGPKGSLVGPNYNITSNLGQQVGNNLFHSFSSFNLTRTQSATFSGPSTIQNVISRVTGGQASSIDGLIRCSINGANVYIVNPAGIVFGPNAGLDITGSFHASTADYIRLGSDGRFNASSPAQSLLTVSDPSAFGFLSNHPTAISTHGTGSRLYDIWGPMRFSWPGKTISLIGGDINLTSGTLSGGNKTKVESRLQAARINLASVASPGEVIPTASGLDVSSFSRLGNITIKEGSGVFALSGRIFISGENLLIDGYNVGHYFGSDHVLSTVHSTDIDILLTGDLTMSGGSSMEVGRNGRIVINAAGSVVVFGTSELEVKYPSHMTRIEGYDSPGEILISAKCINLTDGGSICSSGNMTLRGSESITVSGKNRTGTYSGINTYTLGQLDPASLSVQTPYLLLSEGGTISAESGTSQASADSNVNATRRGGDITLTVNRLDLKAGGRIKCYNYGIGQGGDIGISALELINVSGYTFDRLNKVNSSINNVTFGRGDSGAISIETGQLALTHSGCIAVATADRGNAGDLVINADEITMDGMSQLRVGGSLFGQAGNLYLNTGTLELKGGSVVTNMGADSGQRGNIVIRARNGISISGCGTVEGTRSWILSSNNYQGTSKRITIETPILEISDHGILFAISLDSAAGSDISIRSDILRINGDSCIATKSYDTGQGGSIWIVTNKTLMESNAYITAEGFRTGRAGNIVLTSRDTLQLRNSSIHTSTANADGGDIRINTDNRIHIVDSSITTRVRGGAGNGGDITIDPRLLILDNSRIVADAGMGPGGNIWIAAGDFLRLNTSIVTASSSLRIDQANLTNSPIMDLGGSLSALHLTTLNWNRVRGEGYSGKAAETSTLRVHGEDEVLQH